MKHQKNASGKRFLSLLTVCALLAGNLGGQALGAGGDGSDTPPELRLWYSKPASAMKSFPESSREKEVWQQYTLPIGNGDMGANVYGEIITERLSLNEKTLWSGGPAESRPNYNGGNMEEKGREGATQKEIQRLFLAGENAAADAMCGQLVGEYDEYVYEGEGDDRRLVKTTEKGYGAYQPWGEMKIQHTDLTNASGATNYTRDLSLETAVAGVGFTLGGTTYTREYFMSHPDNVLAAKLTATGTGKLNLNITLPSSQKGTTNTVGSDTLQLSGQMEDNQLKYASWLKAVPQGGAVAAGSDGKSLAVTGADTVYLYFSAATDYQNDYPVYRTGESQAALDQRVKADVDAAAAKDYAVVKADHIADYQSLMGRVTLDLGQTGTAKSTDVLLSDYNGGRATPGERRLLEVMLFQYGRYLTVGSSRADSQLPSNLQGVWNNQLDPAWHSDYHMNVNLQMNYWPTYSTNLAECAAPLVSYIDSLREPGRETARVYAGVKSARDPATGEYLEENGFMAHTQNNPFGWTCPGWSFTWGWSPAAVPWMLQNCWEHYEYTGDLEYMRQNIYPMMKEQARLYDQMLIEDSDGLLVSAPAYSPEHGPKTLGNTYEQTLVWQLYEDTIAAAKLVGEDQAQIDDWTAKQSKLKGPVEIGDSGQIKEWYEETTLESTFDLGAENGHRHLSHMLGLFPGDLISVETPELLKAARISMENRGDEATGWGMGQRINTWARLGDGNKALKLVGDLFRIGIYTNLWDSHAPFQIDGNFGYTSGVAEMLLQSNMDYINLLPALPDAWQTGSVTGLIARGNFEVSMAWSQGGADTVTILSQNGGDAVVRYPGISMARVTDGDGNLVSGAVLGKDRISFPTVEGITYTVTGIPKQTVSAVEDMVAYRLSGDQVELRWKQQPGETYRVYRQIGEGDILPVSDAIDGDSFTDPKALEALGTLRYYLAVVDSAGGEAALTPAVRITDLRNMAGMVDDRDARIVYSGGWAEWGGQEGNYKDTVTFIENPEGGESFSLLFLGTGIELVGVKNTTHGKFHIAIDGVDRGNVDCYSASRQAQQTLFAVSDLDHGVHTITVTATGTKHDSATRAKVEFDALRVLDTSSVQPETVTVGAAGGVTHLWNAGSTLQMWAAVGPEEAEDKSVTWSVAGTDGSATALATISASGLLTVGTSGTGTVRVTATAVQAPDVSGYVDIAVSIPGVSETIVEDSVSADAGKNPAITWTGTWGPWWGESEKHHGGSKTETGLTGDGESFSYTFTGTGVEIYVQKHQNCSSFDITLDEGSKGNYSLRADASDGEPQALLVAFNELENTEHTIICTNKARDEAGVTKYQANLDYIKVLTPGSVDTADKSALLAAIHVYAGEEEADYTPESWAPFTVAFTAAVELMNASTPAAEQAAVTAAAGALTAAGEALESAGVTAPDASTTTAQVLAAESAAITLYWQSVPGAATYKVYSDQEKTALVGSTAQTFFRADDLTSGQEYTFYLTAENSAGSSDFQAPVTVATIDTEAPGPVTNLRAEAGSPGGTVVKWTAAPDNVAVIGYKVYVDGVLQGTPTAAEYTIADLTAGQHRITVLAYDGAGNQSAPASVDVGMENAEYSITVTGGTGTGKHRAGATVSIAPTAAEGERFVGWTLSGVTVPDPTAENLSFVMPSNAVTAKAVFEKAKYAITVTPAANGAITTAPSGSVEWGVAVTVTATPDSGYRLKANSLKINGTVLVGATFVMPKEAVTVTGEFEPIPPGSHAITVGALTNGSVTAAPTEAVRGDTVTLTVTPSVGYVLTPNSLKANGGAVLLTPVAGHEDQYTFTMPDQAVAVTAAFEKAQYGLTLTAQGGGTITADPSGSVVWGTTVTLTMTPDGSSTLKSVTAQGASGPVVVTAGGDGTYTFTMPKESVTVTAVFEAKQTGGGGTSGGGSSNSGSTTTHPDGSKTVTTTDRKSGTVTETTTTTDGAKAVVVTKKDGAVTAQVTLPKAIGGTVTLPMKPMPIENSTVTVALEKPTAVVIPVADAKPGVVAVLVRADGTEEIARKSVTGENGVALTLEGTATLRLKDNSKAFSDVVANHWAADAVAFATSRELFRGTGEDRFSPSDSVTRGMLVTVLHRLENELESTENTGFADVAEGAWYSKAVGWASEMGIAAGTGTGFAPDAVLSREALAVMLYRYAGQGETESNTAARYDDAASISPWAMEAMSWALDVGVITGTDSGKLDPAGAASRAEVAEMLMRVVAEIN